MSGDKVEVQNVNVPDQVTRVAAAKYHAMYAAMMQVMGTTPMTANAIKEAAKAHLPEDLFPAAATSGWWQKTVQLDLEAKGVLQRHATKPLTFSKT
jgi:hypothetical protein